jgi:L-lactate permease
VILLVTLSTLGRGLVKTGEKLHPFFGSELVRAVGALFTGSTLQSVVVLGSKQREFALGSVANVVEISGALSG